MSSNKVSFGEIQQLKKEEVTLCDLINTLKSQLNKLKVEELCLTSKVRHQKGLVRSELTSHTLVNNVPEDVNAIELDLTVKNELLNKLARGGAELLQPSDEEEEDEEDDDDTLERIGELGNGQNDLMNFLENLEN